MEFTYTDSIFIDESDLDAMAERVAEGEDFNEVFNDIMSGYDDVDYYACGYVEDAVKIEVKERSKKY